MASGVGVAREPLARPPARTSGPCVVHTETLCLCLRQKCASQARNPHAPRLGQNPHQMGRHKSILDMQTGISRRISPRIFVEGSNPLNLNFYKKAFGAKNWVFDKKSDFLKKVSPRKGLALGPMRPPWAPWGPQGGHGGPH